VSEGVGRRLTYVANIRLPTEKAHGLQVVRMCEAFQHIGVATTLLHPSRHQPGSLARVDPLHYYGVRDAFAIRTLGNVDVVRTEPWLSSRAYTAAHFAHSALWGWYAVRQAERTAPADLFMTRDITIAFALVHRGLPTVLEIHKAPERWSLRLLRRVATSRHLRLLVTMTEALRHTLESRGVTAPRTRVLHDGVDVSRYDCAPARPWNNGFPVVLYAGHLFREKGIDTLVEAARRLRGRVVVKIAGGMPHHVAEWRARVASDGPENVEFLGHLSPDRMPSLQKGADVLVLPNSATHAHSARYTSPMKLFEYMAAERPIVASDVPAIREVLRHDWNAWLVAPDDSGALAAGIQAVLVDRGLSDRLASTAHTDVRQYSWTERARQIIGAAEYP
jgi:glycosyltransferase involved in cell wall biosynthesis